MTEIKFRITHAAKVFALARGSKEEFEAAVQEAVKDLVDGGCEDIRTIMFHAFSYHGEYNFILFPEEEGMVVDCSEMEESAILDNGPFKGKRVMMPKPFSEGED